MRFTLKNLRFLQYIDYQNVRKTEFLGCQSQEKRGDHDWPSLYSAQANCLLENVAVFIVEFILQDTEVLDFFVFDFAFVLPSPLSQKRIEAS